MKKIILIALFSVFASNFVTAQKHAPRPSNQRKITPGIYPEGSTRYINENDLSGLDSWDLKVFRNEIYARHGYIFNTSEMVNYFSKQLKEGGKIVIYQKWDNPLSLSAIL